MSHAPILLPSPFSGGGDVRPLAQLEAAARQPGGGQFNELKFFSVEPGGEVQGVDVVDIAGVGQDAGCCENIDGVGLVPFGAVKLQGHLIVENQLGELAAGCGAEENSHAIGDDVERGDVHIAVLIDGAQPGKAGALNELPHLLIGEDGDCLLLFLRFLALDVHWNTHETIIPLLLDRSQYFSIISRWDNERVPTQSSIPHSRQPHPGELDLVLEQLGLPSLPEQVTHVRTLPAREAVTVPWPGWVHPRVVEAYQNLGVDEPYLHQVQAATAAQESPGNRHVILATGTASGKSLAYQLPALDAIYRGEFEAQGAGFDSGRATALYLSPTKALAADQLASLRSLNLPGVVAETYDGDTPVADRRFIRERANFVLANPDMLHHAVLPNHARWAAFLRKLKYVIIDEAHGYRGVFGAHVSLLIRRLRRVCRYYGATPVFVGASATSAEPAASFARLIGSRVEAVTAVTESTAPRGSTHVMLWEPEFTDLAEVKDRLSVYANGVARKGAQGSGAGENGAPVRKSVITQAAEMMADLVVGRTRTIAFIKSRRGAEALAQTAGRYLDEVEAGLSSRIAAYRAGYLPEERRALEQALRRGEILGVASTNALELGIDIAGLDAVLVAGWPGTRASFYQQIGRAGRAGQDALAVMIASEDPLDTYLVHHPEDIFDAGIEKTVFDPENPYVLSPHLCAAAAEVPLRREELMVFGRTTEFLLEKLVAQGYLRQRATGWFWTHPESAADLVNLRGGGSPLQIIEAETGSVIGTMDDGHAHSQGHPGAIYTHQGLTYVVEDLDEDNRVIAVSRVEPDYYTQSRDITEVTVLGADETLQQGQVSLNFGRVRVRSQVVGYQRKSLIGQQVLGDEPLDLPPQELQTRAVWWAMPSSLLHAAGIHERDIPGALHAAEHAAIGLLPLVATCDRWDIGGLSTAFHVDTEQPTIFVYDGHPGGAGFAERGFERVSSWVRATLDTILACECELGCPSCVQSPKCGNRNEPLHKAGAARLLATLLVEAGDLTESERRSLLEPLGQVQGEAGLALPHAAGQQVSAVEALTGLADSGDPF